MGAFLLPVDKAFSIKVPTLIAGGEKSQSWLHTAVSQLANVIPKNEFKMLKGQNHDVSV